MLLLAVLSLSKQETLALCSQTSLSLMLVSRCSKCDCCISTGHHCALTNRALGSRYGVALVTVRCVYANGIQCSPLTQLVAVIQLRTACNKSKTASLHR